MQEKLLPWGQRQKMNDNEIKNKEILKSFFKKHTGEIRPAV